MSHNLSQDEITEQAALYAVGCLSEDEAMAFENHLAEGCDRCNEELSAFNLVFEKLGYGAIPEAPPASLRDRLFADLDYAEPSRQIASFDDPVSGSLTIRASEGEWVKLGGGVFTKHLFSDKSLGTVTTMFKLMPGAHMPSHRHLGVEQCMMLEGDFHVNDEVLGPGDFHCSLPYSIDDKLFTVGGALFLIIAPERCEFLDSGEHCS